MKAKDTVARFGENVSKDERELANATFRKEPAKTETKSETKEKENDVQFMKNWIGSLKYTHEL